MVTFNFVKTNVYIYIYLYDILTKNNYNIIKLLMNKNIKVSISAYILSISENNSLCRLFVLEMNGEFNIPLKDECETVKIKYYYRYQMLQVSL